MVQAGHLRRVWLRALRSFDGQDPDADQCVHQMLQLHCLSILGLPTTCAPANPRRLWCLC